MSLLLYRPYGSGWQILDKGALQGLYPGKVYPTVLELLKDHPDAALHHPPPHLPQDIKPDRR